MADLIAGRFALCDPIARGGSGAVWRAIDVRRGRLCAAKVLRQRDAGDLLRFVREQSVRIAGPHVLSPYSWAAEDDHVVIASELAEAGSLSQLLHRVGPLHPVTVAMLLDQLLEALEHVHAAGMIHRDVKPGNVLLHATGAGPLDAQLGDFGLTIGADDARLTQVGWLIGTPAYLAPELLRGHVTPEPRHDLYAAGRVAMALLTGREPTEHDPSVVPGSVGPLRAIVLSLAAPDPAARPASATAARAALRPLLGDPRPFAAGGAALGLGSLLPPLPPAARADLSRFAAAAAGSSRPTGPWAPGTTEPGTFADHPTGAVGPTGYSTPVGPLPHPPHAGRRPRFGLRYAVAGLIAAAAVAAPIVLAVRGGTSAAGTGPSRPPTGTLGAMPVPPTHEIGATCSWQQEGVRATTPGGRPVVCVEGRTSYVWKAR